MLPELRTAQFSMRCPKKVACLKCCMSQVLHVTHRMDGHLSVPSPAHAFLALVGAAGGTGWLHWLWVAHQVADHPDIQLAAEQVGRASTGVAHAVKQWAAEIEADQEGNRVCVGYWQAILAASLGIMCDLISIFSTLCGFLAAGGG